MVVLSCRGAFRYLVKEKDLGARPPKCGGDKMGSLPWIFCIIRSDEVCARVWTTAAFQASKNFRDGAQTHVAANASAQSAGADAFIS